MQPHIEKCPVCNLTELIIDNFKNKYQIVCLSCQTSTNVSYTSIEDAINAWNTMSRACSNYKS